VGEISERQDVNDWTELEQGFFAAAPPDIAVEPPPAATFDDLFPDAPARKRAKRPKSGRRSRGNGRTVPDDDIPAASRVSDAVRSAARIVGGGIRAAAHVVAWSTAQLFVKVRTVAPVSRLIPQAVRSGIGALSARIAPEMPERPDAKTLVAGIAALLVVFGVSASVLGSRGPRPVVAAPTSAPVPAEAVPAEPAPEVVPPAPVAAAPRPTLVLPQLEVIGQQAPAKYHRHHRHRR
jgi:hypothetical protein